VHAELAIGLHRAGDGSVVARGALALAPYWCRWDGATLWIVGSAATPVGEDDITLELHVGEGVSATVRSVAAMVVYAGRGAGTRITTRLHVATGATLVWQPEPVIVTARAHHRAVLVADVADGGTLVIDDVVVLGRSDEAAGRFLSTTELRRNGEAISLTSFDTATPGWSGPGGTAGAKVVGTRVLLPAPDPQDPPRCSSPSGATPGEPTATVDERTVVVQPEGGGTITTTLAADPDQARAQLDAALPVWSLAPRADGQPPTRSLYSWIAMSASPLASLAAFSGARS
jgi:urease accessory protein